MLAGAAIAASLSNSTAARVVQNSVSYLDDKLIKPLPGGTLALQGASLIGGGVRMVLAAPPPAPKSVVQAVEYPAKLAGSVANGVKSTVTKVFSLF
jgi:hypothetical protein